MTVVDPFQQAIQSTAVVTTAACDWPTYEIDQSGTSCTEYCCKRMRCRGWDSGFRIWDSGFGI